MIGVGAILGLHRDYYRAVEYKDPGPEQYLLLNIILRSI